MVELIGSLLSLITFIVMQTLRCFAAVISDGIASTEWNCSALLSIVLWPIVASVWCLLHRNTVVLTCESRTNDQG